jgi:hypothetical protein
MPPVAIVRGCRPLSHSTPGGPVPPLVTLSGIFRWQLRCRFREGLPVGSLRVVARIVDLVRTAPDWAKADPLSTEVRAWLDRVRHVIEELRPAEAGLVLVHLQFVHNDVARHGPEIVETLRRVASMRKSRTG